MSPTVQTQPIVQLTSRFLLHDVSSANLSTGEQWAVRQTQAILLGVSIDLVEYVGDQVVDAVEWRKFAIAARQFELETLQIVATTQLTLNLVNYPQYEENATALIASVQSTIASAVDTGDFVNTLVSVASTVNSSAFDNTTVQHVVFASVQVLPPTMAPTSPPTEPRDSSQDDDDDKLTSQQIAGIIIGVVFGAPIVLYAAFHLYKYLCHCERAQRRARVYAGASWDDERDTYWNQFLDIGQYKDP